VQRVLVVDDSQTMREWIAAALDELDRPLELDLAASGFEALRMLPRQVYDLVVTDINMPNIHGLELISFIRSDPRYAATPLVILSTEGSAEDLRRGLALGANGYLVKPVSAQDLLRVVEDLLARAKP
jgi:two-component system chemotaxis response regulator CheY